MNSRGSRMSCCQSSSERSHLSLPSGSRRPRTPSGLRPPSLYIQCAAIPYSARSCISRVRIWISSGRPSGPITVVCSDWYMLNLGIAMKSLKRPGSGFHSEWITPDGAVGVLDRVDDHAHRRQVVDLVELAALLGHLGVDRVEVLGPAGDLGVDPELGQLLGHVLAGLVDVALALAALLGHQALDLVVLARVQRLEGEVLELPLDRVDAEPVGDRGVDVERLPRLLDLLLLRHRADRAHVVQPVGELDQDHPDVGGHRHDHLAVVLGLRLVAGLEGQPGELGDAVDQPGDLLPERRRHLLQRSAGVLDGVVQQRRAQRLGVEAHAGADLGHADRMGDEVLARAPPLVGVVHAGVDERLLDPLAVDRRRRLVGVLLDDREQVTEQSLLDRRQIGALAPDVDVGVGDVVHRGARAGSHRRGRARAIARGRGRSAVCSGLVATADRSAQALGGWFVLLRYRRPSSYRWV